MGKTADRRNSGEPLKIRMTDHGRGKVFINGEKVPCVKRIRLAAGVDEANEVHLTLIPDVIEIEGLFDVSTIESTMREYKVGDPE